MLPERVNHADSRRGRPRGSFESHHGAAGPAAYAALNACYLGPATAVGAGACSAQVLAPINVSATILALVNQPAIVLGTARVSSRFFRAQKVARFAELRSTVEAMKKLVANDAAKLFPDYPEKGRIATLSVTAIQQSQPFAKP